MRPPELKFPRSRSLRVFLYAGLGGTFVLILAIALSVSSYIEGRITEQHESQVRILSRHQSIQALETAMLEQEAGLRSYMNTGDTRFLEGHFQGVRAEREAFQNLLGNMSQDERQEIRSELDRLQDLIRQWHASVASPHIQARGKGKPKTLESMLEAERQQFERIQELHLQLRRSLDQRDNVRLSQLERALKKTRWLSFLSLTITLLVGLAILHWILRRVAEPLMSMAHLAQSGTSFPEPRLHPIREVDILNHALYELDQRVLEREAVLRQEREEALAVQEVVALLQQLATEEEVLQTLHQAIERLVHPQNLLIFLKSTEPGLHLYQREDIIADFHPILTNAHFCRAFRSGSRVHLPSTAPTACVCALGVPENGSYLCLPLVATGQVLGLVNLQAPTANFWTPQKRRMAESCVLAAASALQAIRALELARERSIRDGLTGVYNRRFLDELMPKLLDQARRQEQPLAALLMDIDHFKKVNDRFGHDGGDRVLMLFAACLQDRIRTGDLLARYGGEEFVLLLPQTDETQALALAERIRASVEAIDLGSRGFPPGSHITTSIGCALFPKHAALGEELIAAADKALYSAKGRGRNRVVDFDDLGDLS